MHNASVLLLPNEVLLVVISLLDISTVLALRQTCKQFSEVTRDKSIWVKFLHLQQQFLPRTLDPSLSDPLHIDVASEEIELEVVSGYLIATAWPLARRIEPVKIQPKSGEFSLLGLQVFLDRWLLSIYVEGPVYLWDLHPELDASTSGNSDFRPRTPTLRATLDLGLKRWTSFSAALESGRSGIVVALTCGVMPTDTHIYRSELPPLSPPNSASFKPLHITSNPVGTRVVRAIDPASKLVVFSTANAVEIGEWKGEKGNGSGSRMMSISMQTDDLEEMWNGIIAIRLIPPHILIFKARSLELISLSHMLTGAYTQGQTFTPPRLIHRFPSTIFRDICFSDLVRLPTCSSQGMESFQFNFLAYDVLQGIFQHGIHVCFSVAPNLEALTTLEVSCIGVYAMAGGVNFRNNMSTTPVHQPNSSSPHYNHGGGSASSPLRISTPTPTDGKTRSNFFGLSGQSNNRAGDAPSSRGFVSAISLGPQAKRAVWVERRRGSTMREVIVWGMDQGFIPNDSAGGTAMEGRVVYTVGSYDLREDVTHCAIGEISGLIVLGSRAGGISILGLD